MIPLSKGNVILLNIFEQVKDFSSDDVEQFKSIRSATGDVGHYTQIAWADTYKVGCGYIMYRTDTWYKKVKQFSEKQACKIFVSINMYYDVLKNCISVLILRYWFAIMDQVETLLVEECTQKENLAVYAQMELKMDFAFKYVLLELKTK